MRIIVCLASLLIASPCLASGGLSCQADDAGVKFTVESGITRGLGNPLFNFRGELDIRDATLAKDLRKSSFDISSLTQHWLDAKELKMQLYRERGGEPFGELELRIETKMVEEGSYEGAYSLNVLDMTGDTSGQGRTIVLEGKTSCFAE